LPSRSLVISLLDVLCFDYGAKLQKGFFIVGTKNTQAIPQVNRLGVKGKDGLL